MSNDFLDAGADAVNGETVIVLERFGFGRTPVGNRHNFLKDDLPGIVQVDLAAQHAADIQIDGVAHHFVGARIAGHFDGRLAVGVISTLMLFDITKAREWGACPTLSQRD